MQRRKNAIAAVMAAVGLYLEAERQLAALQEQGQQTREAPRPVYSPWSMSGRQSAMEVRRFLQMRLVR